MKKWADAWNRLSWGRDFWLFTIRYYFPPWNGWEASLSMKKEDGKAIWMVLRISNIVSNYVQAVIVGVVVLLLAKNMLEANWIGVAVLLAVTPVVVGALLLRLQAPFRLGSSAGARDKADDFL